MDAWAEDVDHVPMNQVQRIETEDEMRELLDRSGDVTVVLFKDSPTCGISMVAREHWDSWTPNAPEGVTLAICDVLAAKAAARAITQWLGIPHQSPQLLVLRDGRCRAHASHYGITKEWLEKNAVA